MTDGHEPGAHQVTVGAVYQDEEYCCMDCGCEHFEVTFGMYDRCNSCGKWRDVKRGIKDAER